MRTGTGKERAQLGGAEKVVLLRPGLPREVVGTRGERLGQPVDERQPRVHLDREPAIRRREEDPPPDPQRLADERLLPLAPADVLDHGVRVDDVERAVGKRERAGVALHVGDRRVPLPEPGAVVEPERRDPPRPRIALLEEVVGRAAALAARLADRHLVDPDVEHRRRRVGPHQLEEERELAPARAERDRVGEPHDAGPYGWITTGVPSGRRASALSVRSVACRHPALAGEPIDSDDDGRPWIARRSPPFQPAGSRGWLPDSTTMQQPRPQRLPGIWSVTWNRPLGVGEPRRSDRDAATKDDPPSLAQRQQPLGEVRLDAEGQPTDVDRRGPRHPADDAVAEHVALHREPVAAPLDDPKAAHRAERRLPRRDGQRPAGRGTADRDLRARGRSRASAPGPARRGAGRRGERGAHTAPATRSVSARARPVSGIAGSRPSRR